MLIAERKILFPKVRPSVPVRKIRQAVRKVAEEARQEAEVERISREIVPTSTENQARL